MSLVDKSERYHLLGVAPVERDDNSSLDGRSDQHVDPQVVYTTNDLEEAKAIAANSGWIQDGQWIAVSGYRDSQRIPDLAAPAPLKRTNVGHKVDQV